MLTKVEVRNVQGSILTLPIDSFDTVPSGILVEGIQGLDPVKATLVASSYSSRPGARLQATHRESRNIIFNFCLYPDYVDTFVEDLRNTLYSFFMPAATVYLRFYKDNGMTVDITGVVEDCPTPLFTQDPKTTVSIMCFDPDFSAIDSEIVEGETVSDVIGFDLEYDGSVPVGVLFTLLVDRTLSEFTIYHTPADGRIRTFDFAGSLIADDVLKISSVSGSKSVMLTRSGTETSALYGKSPQSTWLELQPGNNNIRVYALGAAIPFTITYINLYGGL